MSKLVIVESPAKAKTIEKYLPRDYKVRASLGHVRDLPDNASQLPKKYRKEPWAKLGVNVDEDFEAVYVVKDKQSRKAIKELKSELTGAEEIYLATDEDREGEAISWHLVEELAPDVPTRRMVFHEITRSAIEDALAHTRDIDENLVHAQEARRILDRLVGYPLSLLVGKKIKYGLSAGRVQSAAVRLLVARERERRAFRVGTYWDLKADLDKTGEAFKADLISLDGTRLASGKDFDKNTGKIAEGKDVLLLGEKKARELLDALEGRDWTVKSVTERRYTTSPKAPFITSTLQQEASRKLNLSASHTMSIAQRLYENGHITYMRTDSTNLSKQATTAARRAARDIYGEEYVHDKVRRYASSSKGAQEAHEAIRPSGEHFVHPDKSGLTGRQKALYDLIWKRTVACQMADARKRSVRVELEVEVDGHTLIFRASGNRTDFAGFISAYLEGTDDPEEALAQSDSFLPEMTEGDQVACTGVEPIRHETKPPARYTEASLVKALEEAGVGRPSTYASIMSKITYDDRYARKSGKTLVPTYMAFAVTELLEDHFPGLVDLQFTARMEDDLDDIARGKGSKVDYLHSFYRASGAFSDQIDQGESEIEPDDARVVHLQDFPATLKVGRYGPYAQIEQDGETKTIDIPDEIPPADLDYDAVLKLLEEREKGPRSLGEHPDAGLPILLMNGRYGWYVQLGERSDENKKPRTSSVPDHWDAQSLTLEQAVKLLSLPRKLGEHPEDGKPIEVNNGRYGPYVRHKKDYRSLKNFDQLFEIELDEALEMLNQPKKGRRRRQKVLKELGKDPESGNEINVLDGRYGPYVKLGKTNASLPKGTSPDDMTLESALKLIEEKRKG